MEKRDSVVKQFRKCLNKPKKEMKYLNKNNKVLYSMAKSNRYIDELFKINNIRSMDFDSYRIDIYSNGESNCYLSPSDSE